MGSHVCMRNESAKFLTSRLTDVAVYAASSSRAQHFRYTAAVNERKGKAKPQHSPAFKFGSHQNLVLDYYF